MEEITKGDLLTVKNFMDEISGLISNEYTTPELKANYYESYVIIYNTLNDKGKLTLP